MSTIMEWKTEFETYLRQSLQDITDSTVKEAMLYSLLIGGKRLRPMFLLTALMDYEIDYRQAFPIAAAIEMIHTYSLIHDDLPAMDNDVLRRGQPTCHVKYREATAILAGDALLTQAFAMVMKSSYPALTKCQIVDELAAASGADGMILGQHYDLQAEHQADLAESTVVQIDALKTGRLIALPLRLAVIIANRDAQPATYREELMKMSQLGEELGIAFQIQDDILNVTSSPEILGKSIHSDSHQGKSTYLTLMGLEGAKQEVQRRFQRVYQLEEQRQVKKHILRTLIDTIIQRSY